MKINIFFRSRQKNISRKKLSHHFSLIMVGFFWGLRSFLEIDNTCFRTYCQGHKRLVGVRHKAWRPILTITLLHNILLDHMFQLTIFFKHLALAKLHRGYKIADCRKASCKNCLVLKDQMILPYFSYFCSCFLIELRFSWQIWFLMKLGSWYM